MSEQPNPRPSKDEEQAADHSAPVPTPDSAPPAAAPRDDDQPAEAAATATDPQAPPTPEPSTPASDRPRPSAPKPSALPRRTPSPAQVAPVAAVAPRPDDAREAAAAAAWGRVAEDGTVWVRETAGERAVGQYAGADRDEALGLYVRRFLDLQAQVTLFESRLGNIGSKEIDQILAGLTEALEAPAAVGDLDALRTRLVRLRERAAARRKEITAQRQAEKATALAARTELVERAEAIAAADPGTVHWRSAGNELRELLDTWKQAQRNDARIDKPVEDALWKRFSRSRSTFERRRGQFFSELDASHAEVKRAKEQLISEAEALSSSTDWGAGSAAYRDLMDRWKAAGRASRKEDDALWARFRDARQVFYEARNAKNAEIDAEYGANLEVKLALLKRAEALLPVRDLEAARRGLRSIQDEWESAGKVPRADVQRVEGRMRAVEQAVRDADQERWRRTDPEKQARVDDVAAQLEGVIADLERKLADATDRGDAAAVKAAEDALAARRTWMRGIMGAADA